MPTTSPTFTTTASLITASRVVENAAKALAAKPEGIGPLDGFTPIEQALLCELNRFPGAVAFTSIPKGEALRETILAAAKERAEAYEASTPWCLSRLTSYCGIPAYLQNLRQLFLIADLDAGEAIQQPDPYAHIKHDPSAAIEFALSNLEGFEVEEFLREWKSGADLSPWFKALRTDQNATQGDWSGHDTHPVN